MKKYVISRKDVYGGQLLKDFSSHIIRVFDYDGIEIDKEVLEKHGMNMPILTGGVICRGMLFSIDENALANDLIYTTPSNYRIEGIEPKIEVESPFVIEECVNLDELLKYLKYGEDLTQSDLNQIYRKLICSNFWLEHHMELFGWQKNKFGYVSGGREIISRDIYNHLSFIAGTKNGKPYKEEPEYSLIKKRK